MADTFKNHRFERNLLEKKMVDEFSEEVNLAEIESRVFGDFNSKYEILTKRELKIVNSTVQWLGTEVGQDYLKRCGFEKV
jgi:hypothetical protein